MNFFVLLKSKYHYTEHEIKLIQYTLKTFVSEFSKLIILGLFFSFVSKFYEYLLTVLIFLFLRRYSGGYHCKTYLSCFIISFLYMFLNIMVLPNYSINIIFKFFLLLGAFLIINSISPLPSFYHKKLNQYQISKYRTYIDSFLIIYTILVLKFPNNRFILIGFWEIIIHTLQLSIEFFKRKRCI